MWQSILYGWIALSGLTITGETWYASPPARWQIHTVDEIEILLGATERCYATETSDGVYGANPMSYVYQIRNTNSEMETVTNALVSQVAPIAMLTDNDNSIKDAVPLYFEPDSIFDGATNFVELSFTNLIAEEGMEFADWGWWINYTNYEDRYKVLNALKKTQNTATQNYWQIWTGEARSPSSFDDAFGNAITNYSLKSATNTLPDGVVAGQWTRSVFWSNFVYQGGSGATNLFGVDGELETHEVTNFIQIVDYTISNNFYISHSNIWVENDRNYQVVNSVQITGSSTPDMAGIYYYYDEDPSWLYQEPLGYPFLRPEDGYITYGLTPHGLYALVGDLNGTECVWEATALGGSYAPDTNTPARGELMGAHYCVTNELSLAPTGEYFKNGTNDIWERSGWYIYLFSGVWILHDSVDYSGFVLGDFVFGKADSPVGSWSPSWFRTEGTESSWTNIYAIGPYPIGGSGDGPPYLSYNGYYLYTDYSSWYISTNTDITTNCWIKSDYGTGNFSYVGTYPAQGTGIYGEIYVYIDYKPVTSNGPTYYTNGPQWYCGLAKVGASNDIFFATNVAPAPNGINLTYYYKPITPEQKGVSNIWDSQETGFIAPTESVHLWQSVGEFEVTNSSDDHGLWVIGDCSAYPVNVSEPTNINVTIVKGFQGMNVKAIRDWDFLYSTNKYW